MHVIGCSKSDATVIEVDTIAFWKVLAKWGAVAEGRYCQELADQKQPRTARSSANTASERLLKESQADHHASISW